jgi:hypothetical protein
MEMVVRALDQGGIEFQSRLLGEEPRSPLPLLDAAAPRAELFVRVCSWCKKVATGEAAWLEAEHALALLDPFSLAGTPQVTHGMCPECYVQVVRAIPRKPVA